MSDEENYDLKGSAEGIGQLYPVLVDKKGRVIDGFHRLQANPKWRVQPLDNIDTDEKLLVARCISNWHRRAIGRAEKAEWINGLAEIYKKQGLAEGGFAKKISEVIGLSKVFVREYLKDEFKEIAMSRTEERPERRVPASQRIETSLGPEIVVRHREEVRKEIQAEVRSEVKAEVKKEVLAEERPKIVEQTRKELLENPSFREEAFKKELEERAKKAETPPVFHVAKYDEAQDVIDEIQTVWTKIVSWGINQSMILMKANRWQEAVALYTRIEDRMVQLKVTRHG